MEIETSRESYGSDDLKAILEASCKTDTDTVIAEDKNIDIHIGKDIFIDSVYNVTKAKLGSGAFSNVYLAYSKDKAKLNAVAVKVLSKSLQDNVDTVHREVEMLKLVKNCKECINIYDFFEDDVSYSIVLEYAGKKNFHEFYLKDLFNQYKLMIQEEAVYSTKLTQEDIQK